MAPRRSTSQKSTAAMAPSGIPFLRHAQSLAQKCCSCLGNQLFVSVIGDTEAARRKIDADLATIDPDAVKRIQKLQIREWVDEDAYYTFRLAYWASSAIGLLALVLTLSGVYGVLSYVISQRTKEIGIRMAMGASTRAVTDLVLKQSMRLAVVGAITGSVLATGVSKVLASVLNRKRRSGVPGRGGRAAKHSGRAQRQTRRQPRGRPAVRRGPTLRRQRRPGICRVRHPAGQRGGRDGQLRRDGDRKARLRRLQRRGTVFHRKRRSGVPKICALRPSRTRWASVTERPW
jgi:hypothetical protein